MAADSNSGKDSFIAEGFEFVSENDAQKAAMDQSKIKILEARVKVSKPSDIKAVYDKSIENKIFKTPVGWEYLHGLRKKLLESGYADEELVPIPVGVSMTKHSALDNLAATQRNKNENQKSGSAFGRIFPIVLDVALAILVIILFYISLTGETDNMINYKRNITNRYSSWEQELSDREKKVREAEKKLGIEDATEYHEGTD